MAVVEVRRVDGSTVRSIELDAGLFGIQPNVPVLHQVVTAQLAAARRGTQSTLTRAEVAGGGSKPWRQKGTGRARQGSTRSPQWSGGGVALGPKPRSYRQKTPKKMIRLALRSALSDRAAEQRIAVVEAWPFTVPRTKDAKAALATLGLDGKVLLVLSREDDVVYRSFRNLPDVQLILREELNAYDVLCNEWIVFTEATLPGESREAAVAEPAVAQPAAAEAATADAAEVLPEAPEVESGAGPETQASDAGAEGGEGP